MKRMKRYITPTEAVLEGYFSSEKQAATLRCQKRGPSYFKPNGGRIIYDRRDLETWLERGRMLTAEQSVPFIQRI